MKKTGFEKSFNFKQILITLAAGAAVLLPVRIYQLFAIIDTGSTGFYKKNQFQRLLYVCRSCCVYGTAYRVFEAFR